MNETIALLNETFYNATQYIPEVTKNWFYYVKVVFAFIWNVLQVFWSWLNKVAEVSPPLVKYKWLFIVIFLFLLWWILFGRGK